MSWDGVERRGAMSSDHDDLIEIKTIVRNISNKQDNFIQETKDRLEKHDKSIEFNTRFSYIVLGAVALAEFILRVIK